MTTLATSLQMQIDAINAKMLEVSPTSVGANGISETNPDWVALSKRLTSLYALLGRANGTSPMIIRGVVKGL